MKTKTLVFLAYWFPVQVVLAQSGEKLILAKPEFKPDHLNTISFQVSPNLLKNLHDAKGEKLSMAVPIIAINDDTLKTKHIRVRGNTSSYFRRKSFNIKVTKKATFRSLTDTFSLTKIYAICMNMDRNYIRNKIAYEVLKRQHVLTPENAYSNLVINGKSEGLYLIFYPPDEFALNESKFPLLIRRGYDASIDKLSSAGLERQEIKALKDKFNSLYKLPGSGLHGEQLYASLSRVLNLTSYFSWLAFNHLFQNGDYADEVYFVWDETQGLYEIIPWDLDDLLRAEPHEGAHQRKRLLGDKLIFSSEDKLDVMIANDPYVYKEYLKVYKDFLEQLTPEEFADILQGLWKEVSPYYLMDDVIAQSQFDQFGKTDSTKLEEDLGSIYQSIILNRQRVLKEISILLEK